MGPVQDRLLSKPSGTIRAWETQWNRQNESYFIWSTEETGPSLPMILAKNLGKKLERRNKRSALSKIKHDPGDPHKLSSTGIRILVHASIG
jgi:hypothetical protein